MKSILSAFFFLISLFLPINSFALETIEILGGKASMIPIAVTHFHEQTSLTKNQTHKINQIIDGDLRRSGLFDPLNVAGVGSYPRDAMEVNYSNWSAMQAQFLILGKIEADDIDKNKIKVTWSLVDIFKQNIVMTSTLAGTISQYRAIAHNISDTVYEKLTGTPGVFHTKIAFVKKISNAEYALIISDFDGFNQKSIVKTNKSIISPRWSPDGKKIAYVSFEKNKPVIYIQNLETGKRILLANFKGNNSAPAWSPDSKKLAIVLTYSANSQLYIINEDGSDIRQLMRTYSINTEPAWAPNGDEIYYVSDRGGNGQIYKVNINNNEVTRVTYEGKNNLSPSISPDGKLLLFISQKDGKYRVALQNLLNNQYLTLTEGPQDESPLFAPNGHMVLFTYKDYGKTTKIATVSINGLMKTPIDLGKDIVLESTWGPLKK
jgi:TolB protein